MHVLILYNEPTLAPNDPDRASEAGVLESVAAVETVLRSAGHEVRQLGLSFQISPLLAALAPRPLVFNFCEGFSGRSAGESWVTGLLELSGVPFTGCPSEAMSLCRHKPRTKYLLRGAGLPTADFLAIERLPIQAAELAFPLIVKPGAEDASLGLDQGSVVTSDAALQERVERLLDCYGLPILIERFIDGREFNVGLYEVAGEVRALPPAEVIFPRDGSEWPLLTYKGKWEVDSPECIRTPVRCPAEVEPERAATLARLARRAFELTGCRDYARVDFRVSPAGTPYILEVNANPDLAPTAGYARALSVEGIPYDTMILNFIQNAVRRSTREAALAPPVFP